MQFVPTPYISQEIGVGKDEGLESQKVAGVKEVFIPPGSFLQAQRSLVLNFMVFLACQLRVSLPDFEFSTWGRWSTRA